MFFDQSRRTHDALVSEYFQDGVRVRWRVPALRLRLREEARARNWPAAVTTLREIVTGVRARYTRKQDLPTTLRSDYLNLSWHELLAGDAGAALASALAGQDLDPAWLPLKTNQAHALLLLGRTAEAEALYREHIGKVMPGNDGRTWEAEILADLDQLEADGVSHPAFPRIRRLMQALSASPG